MSVPWYCIPSGSLALPYHSFPFNEHISSRNGIHLIPPWSSDRLGTGYSQSNVSEGLVLFWFMSTLGDGHLSLSFLGTQSPCYEELHPHGEVTWRRIDLILGQHPESHASYMKGQYWIFHSLKSSDDSSQYDMAKKSCLAELSQTINHER